MRFDRRDLNFDFKHTSFFFPIGGVGCGEVGVYGTPQKPRKHAEKNESSRLTNIQFFNFGRRKM